VDTEENQRNTETGEFLKPIYIYIIFVLTQLKTLQVRSATSAVVGDKIYSFGGFYTLDDYQEIKPMNVHIMETGTIISL